MSKAVCVAAALAALAGSLAIATASGEAKAPKKDLRAVVVVGGHGYDTKAFPKAFEGHEGIACEIREERPKDKPSLFADISNWNYDVIVLYNFSQKPSEAEQANFLKLMDRGVGLVVLHHAIAAYPAWPEWEKILDAKYYLAPAERNGVKKERSIYKHGEDIKVHLEDADHPITRGLADFTGRDETYGKWDYLGNSHILLTTDHPLNTKQIGWVRMYRNSRVFFCQLGHGPEAFTDKNFRHLVGQGVRWAGKQLEEGKVTAVEPKPAAK